MIKTGISYIDLAIFIGLIFFTLKGYSHGFTEELVRILGTLVGLIMAIKFMSNLSTIIIEALNILPIIAIVISFAAIFFVVVYLFKYIADKIGKVIKLSLPFELGGIDKILGMIFGLAKGAIIISLITIFLSFINLFDFSKKHIRESDMFEPMQRIAPLAYETIKVIIPKYQPFLKEFNENFSGVSIYKRTKVADKFIESLKKK